MNQPYVKQYDEQGLHSNPIIGKYPSTNPNRKARRNKGPRFKGNHRGISLTVVGADKFYRVRQLVHTKEGNKTIEHYLPANKIQ